MVRQGNAAPARPRTLARSRAWSSVAWRHHSALTAADGAVAVRTGSTKVSLSQKQWPS